jgi:hypothetical protein
MAKKDIDEVILGAGELYLMEFSKEIPSDEEIEIDDNNVGHTQGGFSVEYKPTKYNVENSYGKIVKSFITKEEITAKTGLLTWNMDNLKYLAPVKVEVDTKKKIKTLTFGGSGNKLTNVLLRFVHEKENGKKVRFTMIGQGGNGFTTTFADTETVIDSEFQAIEKIKNFLACFEEELTDEEAESYEVLKNLVVTSVAGSSSGDTKITVTPEKYTDNAYLYKTSSSSIDKPSLNEVVSISDYTQWNGTDEITASTGDNILIVEINKENKVKGVGITTVKSQI